MALLAGCSDQASTASGSAPTSVSATCTSLQSLSKAVSGLVASGGGAGAIASVPGRIDTVQRAVDDARTTASAQLRTEIDAFAASVRSLRSTLASVGTASDLGATVTAIQRAVTDVSASWQRLRSAAQTELAGCDLGSG